MKQFWILQSKKSNKIFIFAADKRKGGVKIKEILLFSAIVTAGLSFLLFFISMVSFKRMREIKLFFISIALLLFFIKGIISLIYQEFLNFLVFIDLIIVLMLYLAATGK